MVDSLLVTCKSNHCQLPLRHIESCSSCSFEICRMLGAVAKQTQRVFNRKRLVHKTLQSWRKRIRRFFGTSIEMKSRWLDVFTYCLEAAFGARQTYKRQFLEYYRRNVGMLSMIIEYLEPNEPNDDSIYTQADLMRYQRLIYDCFPIQNEGYQRRITVRQFIE